MFDNLSKKFQSVSHKIFHNLQIPTLSAFIAATAKAISSQLSFQHVYSKVISLLHARKIALLRRSKSSNQVAMTGSETLHLHLEILWMEPAG
jgi:hypothetical protein